MKSKFKYLLVSAIAVALVVVGAACGKTADAPAADAPAEDTATVSEDAIYNAGSYTADAKGMQDMKVEVVFSDTEILEVNVVEHNETEGISDAALENIPKEIIASQSTEVDSVAGATLTSTAIIDAVNDCLEQAAL